MRLIKIMRIHYAPVFEQLEVWNLSKCRSNIQNPLIKFFKIVGGKTTAGMFHCGLGMKYQAPPPNSNGMKAI